MQGSAMTNLLASYVPRLIQKRVAQNPIPIESPFASDFHGAFLFADISGFTRLTERLAEKGPMGVEKLAGILNDYFGQLIDLVYEYGGDVVKFAGDAVIAAWPFESASGLADALSEEEVQRRWMLHAAECAFTIRERLLKYRAEDTTLYLKFSLGAGRVWESHIGGIFNRWEFVVVGNPMIEIGLANDMAKAGEIIAAPSAWELLKGHCDAEEMEFMAVPSLEHMNKGVAARLEKLKTKSNLAAGNEAVDLPDEAQSALRPYLPGSIISRISAGQSDWLAEQIGRAHV